MMSAELYPIEMRAHVMEIAEIEEELDTSVDKGLISAAHRLRLEECGPNSIPEQKNATVLELL